MARIISGAFPGQSIWMNVNWNPRKRRAITIGDLRAGGAFLDDPYGIPMVSAGGYVK